MVQKLVTRRLQFEKKNEAVDALIESIAHVWNSFINSFGFIVIKIDVINETFVRNILKCNIN